MLINILIGCLSISAIIVAYKKAAIEMMPPECIKKLSAIMGKIQKTLLFLSAGLTCTALMWIMLYIISKGAGQINWEFVSTAPFKDEGGVFPMIITSVWLTALSLFIATPVGVCAAIYINEYAKPGKIVNAIVFAIESLTGIPSIIYGLFGLLFFVTFMNFKYSIFSGALTVSIMVLPVIIKTSQESLKTVPRSFREGSLALGASKIRTIARVALPSAIPGILSGVILGIGRIIGETAAVYMTAGMVPKMPATVMNSGRTLAVHLYLLAKEGISFERAYATATILIVVVLCVNLMAGFLAKSINRGLTGSK